MPNSKATSKDEYNSLRQEILNHQNQRLTVLGLALTVTAALIAAGIERENPILPLMAPFLLLAARVQIIHIHAGIQRISSYIRIILEDDNPDLNWEKASYFVRSSSITEKASVRNITPLNPLDSLLFFTGVASNSLAIYMASPLFAQKYPISFDVIIGVALFWLLVWVFYYFTKVREWNNMSAEDNEAKNWKNFRESKLKKLTRKKDKPII